MGLNPTRQAQPVRLEIGAAWGSFDACRTLWGAAGVCQGGSIELTAPARDVTVLELA